MMILQRYFARRYAGYLLMITVAFTGIQVMLNLVEALRGNAGGNASFTSILSLTLLNTPGGLSDAMPLIVILASIALFLSLARSSELVVTRAAGRSALRALAAPVLTTFILGLVVVAALNPIVAATSKLYEQRQQAMHGLGSAVTVGPNGLWLRQGDASSQTVIHADRASGDGTELWGVTFITFKTGSGPVQRIDADHAVLGAGIWQVEGAKSWDLAQSTNPEAGAVVSDRLDVPTTLTETQIRDSFGPPSMVSIWDLPGFINRLKLAGFSSLRHEVWFQMELARPLFLVAMVLIGSAFTMRHQRAGRTGVMVLAAIAVAFGLYFLRNFARVMGENEQLPAMLAAWSPPLIGIGLALGLILHLEDG